MAICISPICRAEDRCQGIDHNEEKWASELGVNSTTMVWRQLQELFATQAQLEIDRNGIAMKSTQDRIDITSEHKPRQFTGLYIFVSASMPKPLLKTYMQDASKYGGVLVFRGLPGGSFKALTALIVELTPTKNGEAEHGPNMQIDDEAFARFNITAVPSIVLAKEADYVPNQEASIIYDKIAGNVLVKYALEQFSRSGDLYKRAADVLYESK